MQELQKGGVVIDLIDDDDNFEKKSNVVENENDGSNPSSSKGTYSSQNNDTDIKTYTGYCNLCKIAYPINQNSTLVDHFKSNQHQTNLKAKHFKNVLAAQQDEDLREATA